MPRFNEGKTVLKTVRDTVLELEKYELTNLVLAGNTIAKSLEYGLRDPALDKDKELQASLLQMPETFLATAFKQIARAQLNEANEGLPVSNLLKLRKMH